MLEPASGHLVPESTSEIPSFQRRIALFLATTRAVADAPSLVDAARRALAALSDAEGASAGILWVATEASDRLRCAEVWSAPAHPAAELARVSRDATILRGEGLAGRAWASGRTAVSDPERAWREGFRALAAIPLPLGPGGELAGVLELFEAASRPRARPDALTEEIWTALGVTMGQLARRVALERAVRRAEEHTEDARRRSEAQLIEADRLASLGRLAAGVAHEINNPLSYVLLNLDVLLREAAADTERGPDTERGVEMMARLREARAGVERVRLIAQDLKSFSRVDTERRVPVDVRRVLDSTLEIAANEIRHRARLVRDYHDVPTVHADPSRLGQVFLNLLVNAAQAIAPQPGTTHEIRVSTAVDASGRVVVAIADTGAGVPAELLERIFDPFFTTKPAGVGTGLGLSIVRGIITALGGEIAVESRLGHGTTFRVVLPASSSSSPVVFDEPTPPPVTSAAATRKEGAAGARATGTASAATPSPRARRGRVLIIDDEPALAAALARSIDRDYEVVVIANGQEGLERLREDAAFDVILCDLIMPHVTGMDIFTELQRTAPALAERVVFMSGGTFTVRTRDFLAGVSNPVLDKPFDIPTLSALLRARTRR